MINVDLREIYRFERELSTFSKRAAPYANANALTAMARVAQVEGRAIVKEQFVNRNTWTARSVVYNRAKPLPIGQAFSEVGSVAPYMARQELGGTKQTKGKHGAPIPTRSASGEGRGGGVRKKLPKIGNRLKNLTLTNRSIKQGHTNGQRQRNAIAVTTAIRNGGGVVFLHLARRKGIFRVTGTRKSANIEMLYDLSHPQILTPRNEWLQPATARAVQQGPALYIKALQRQIELAGLYAGRRGR